MKPEKKDVLVDAMNELATAMLKGSTVAGVQNQIDVFSAVTKWIAVKNRLNLSDEADGSKIDAYRDALADTPARDAVHRTYGTKRVGRTAFENVDIRNKAIKRSLRARGRLTREDRGAGGTELDAIKSRLPDANGDDLVGNRDDARGARVVVHRRGRRIRPGVLDAAGPGDANGAGG